MSNLIQVLHIASANFILRVACLAAAARLILKTRTQRILLYGNCEITVTQHLGRRLDSELLAYVKCVMRWLQVAGTFAPRKKFKSPKQMLWNIGSDADFKRPFRSFKKTFPTVINRCRAFGTLYLMSKTAGSNLLQTICS